MGKKSNTLGASSKAIDPTLDALFSSSLGPVKAPESSRYSSLVEPTPQHTSQEKKERKKDKKEKKSSKKAAKVEEEDDGEDEDADDAEVEGKDEESANDDEELSEGSEELDYEDDQEESSEAEEDDEEDGSDAEMAEVSDEPEQPKRERKRKRKDENDDLEDKYMAKLADDDEEEPAEKRFKKQAGADSDDDEDDKIPQHESLAKDKDAKSSELEKADRTVFVANASAECISSKKAKRTLLNHLSSVLDSDAGEKIETMRFRSVAFATGSMPKRAAYITKQLMEATTKSTNAYVVYSSVSGARKSANKLNGTEALGRHMRLDSVSHPTPTDHRRCVFVGNLGFVDDESVLNDNEDGETVKTKRNKVPADIEEGLWRTFGKCGKVENVRVIRDPKTRVGKGIAYVQFYDGNSVESALLMNEKKFPPMLPRKLRVTRAKDPRKTAMAQEREKERMNGGKNAKGSTKYRYKATPEEKSQAGRASKLLGRAGAAMERRRGSGKGMPNGRGSRQSEGDNNDGGDIVDFKTPEHIIFEGTRASSKNGRPKDLKLGKKGKGKPKNAGRPTHRSARRAASWKKKD